MSRRGIRLGMMLLATFILMIVGSYLLALAGEPQSVWVWREVLGIR